MYGQINWMSILLYTYENIKKEGQMREASPSVRDQLQKSF